MRNEAEGSRATTADSPRDFVSDGVRLGYQVIDTYFRQGEKIARQFLGTSYGAATGNGQDQEPDIRSVQLVTELMATWSDLFGVYTEALSSATGPVRPTGQPQERRPVAAESNSSASAVQLAYELTSRRPALVDVEFFPGRATPDLTCDGLRCIDSSAAEIPVLFEKQPDRQRTVVSICVSDDQPAGLYTAVLLDSHGGAVVGTVSLRVR